MENNQSKTLAEELAEVNRLNEGFVDPEPVEQEKEKEEAPKSPETPEEKPKENTDQQEKPAEAPADPVEKKTEEQKPEPRTRPDKYIPVSQYTSEKREWKTQKETLEAKIKELETVAVNTNKGTNAEDEEVKAYAEKHNMDEEAVRDLLKMARKGQEISPERLKALDQIQSQEQERLQKEQQDKELEHFNQEWNSFAPSIQSQYPNATPEQLSKARELMDKISHTKKYASTDLDYILFKEKSQFEALLEARQSTETPPQKRTMEAGRPSGPPTKLSASDIKGKDDFIKIFELPEDERNKLISSMDPLMFDNYVKWEAANESEIEIKRDGRIIRLK